MLNLKFCRSPLAPPSAAREEGEGEEEEEEEEEEEGSCMYVCRSLLVSFSRAAVAFFRVSKGSGCSNSSV